MNKQEFLAELRRGLSGFPAEDIEERVNFYGEMIDDRMEDGSPEEAAVSGVGTVEEIVSATLADIPLTRLVKEKIKPKRRMRAWEIVFLVLGSPVWLSLLIAVFAVIFSLYLVLWSVMLALWAVFAALAVSVPACIGGGIILSVTGKELTGIACIGAGLVCAGCSVLMFFGCKAAAKGILLLTKKLGILIKHCFMNREEEK